MSVRRQPCALDRLIRTGFQGTRILRLWPDEPTQACHQYTEWDHVHVVQWVVAIRMAHHGLERRERVRGVYSALLLRETRGHLWMIWSVRAARKKDDTHDNNSGRCESRRMDSPITELTSSWLSLPIRRNSNVNQR